jgi:hypothetical protein
VEWEGSAIRIPDFDELKRVAEFDDRYLHHRNG